MWSSEWHFLHTGELPQDCPLSSPALCPFYHVFPLSYFYEMKRFTNNISFHLVQWIMPCVLFPLSLDWIPPPPLMLWLTHSTTLNQVKVIGVISYFERYFWNAELLFGQLQITLLFLLCSYSLMQICFKIVKHMSIHYSKLKNSGRKMMNWKT